jgi:hypothetical protein
MGLKSELAGVADPAGVTSNNSAARLTIDFMDTSKSLKQRFA